MVKQTQQPIIRIEGLKKNYGAVQALRGVDFEVMPGELCGLIGPNGSGKTTLFDCCTGLQLRDEGKVYLSGTDISGWKMNRISREGRMVRSFQKTVVFSSMTVIENLITAGQMFEFPNFMSTFSFGSGARKHIAKIREHAMKLIELTDLTRVQNYAAGTLSLGQQKLLQFAFMLMTEPTLVLLDEPLAGINPILIDKLIESIKRANMELGITFVVIEHNIDVLFDLCERIVVLVAGTKLAEGSPEEIVNNKAVVEAYLG